MKNNNLAKLQFNQGIRQEMSSALVFIMSERMRLELGGGARGSSGHRRSWTRN